MLFSPFDVWNALKIVKPEVIHVHDPELIPVALLWRLGRERRRTQTLTKIYQSK